MGVNALKIWFGHMRRHKAINLLNLLGLSIGMAAFVLIALFVQYQLSYDRWHEKSDRIYRVWGHANLGPSNELTIPSAAPPTGPAIQRESDGVETFVRFWYLDRPEAVSHDTITYMEEHVGWADSTLFDVFSYKLIQGDPKSCLARKQTAILSQSAARRYFGTSDPVGREIVMNNRYHYTITGVYEDITKPSHLPTFPIIGSFVSLELNDEASFLNNNSYPTYLLLKPGVSPESVEARFPGMLMKRDADIMRSLNKDNPDAVFQLHLQPLKDVYLRSPRFDFDFVSQGSMQYVLMFAAIGLFTLVVAILNFVNLTTAVATTRAKQVGISKSIGADRGQLVMQFLQETVAISLVAMGFAILLAKLAMPEFRDLSALDIHLHLLSNPWTLPLLAGFAVLVGLIAGLYPALYLSSFRPVEVLKGQLRTGRKGSRIRAVLVVLQFAVSVTLIVGTLVIVSQMKFLSSKRLGYDREHLLVLSLIDDNLRPHWQAMRDEIKALPGVKAIAATDGLPNMSYGQTVYHIPDKQAQGDVTMWMMSVGEDYFDVMGMQVAQGRAFDYTIPSDTADGVLLNETAARKIGWANPLNQTVQAYTDVNPPTYRDFNVIGVVRDFNFESLHNPIRPLAIRAMRGDPLYLVVRLHPGNTRDTLDKIRGIWKSFGPSVVFSYRFMDDVYDNLYKGELRTGKLFAAFAGFAILIACLGLFALSRHAAEQRTKEIGVRKVLGATPQSIVGLLAKEFLRLVVIANLIAWPLAWFLMNRWLNDFAYRVQIGVWIFAASGLLTLAIALATVSVQAVRASLLDPVKSLRHE